MEIISTIKDFLIWRKKINGSIGFVPTMGALHKGHLSLIANSINTCDVTIVSIFINPTQFAINEDFNTYPKMIESDIKQLENYNIDCVFLPTNSDIYPNNIGINIDIPKYSKIIEGKSRPHFFQGVLIVVVKLFNIVKPTHAFFGKKDAQQLFIIRQMVNSLHYSIKIIGCPIIREKSGLALSSRNQYLNQSQSIIASRIYQSLKIAKVLINSGEKNVNKIKNKLINFLNKEKIIQIDYIYFVNSYTFEEYINVINNKVLVCIAVLIKEIRLIDNIECEY
tara:strand:- start:2108 stop:2947 length:840 start_codon:yes stop_codon:yes gene_type:complete